MLQKLKDSGNPYFQKLFTPEEYRMQCQKIDTSGYKLIYGNDDLMEDLDARCQKNSMIKDEIKLDTSSDETDDSSEESAENDGETETNKKETKSKPAQSKGIQKHQFIYDQEVCMTDKYPEISVAPGEGQLPENIL